MTSLFGLERHMQMRDVGVVLPDQPFSLPFAFHREVNWLDFSSTANPLGAPKSFSHAMQASIVDGGLIYAPDRNSFTLRNALARYFNLTPESFVCGASVSDMLRGVAQTYRPCKVGIFSPSLGEYTLAVENAGHKAIPLKNTCGFVLPDFQTARENGGDFEAVVLANPSYPTSRLLSETTLKSYLEVCDWVVVDESLLKLSLSGESTVPLIRRYPNLIVVSSLASAYAIPGIPISYCIASASVAVEIEKFFDNSSISMFSDVLADLVQREQDYLERTRDFLSTEIPWMQCMLSLVPGVSVFPAEANYVMCSYNNSYGTLGIKDTSELLLRLQLAGFFVRKLEGMPGITGGDYFCVSVRKREDNERLLAALRHIVRSH